MRIFAIGDLHLSGNPPSKPMTLFGSQWSNHWEKIKESWLSSVSNEDVVLLAGDTSWAMKWQDAKQDLMAITALPGQKVLIRGNHDYWWQTLAKMNNEMSGRLFFLHNNHFEAGDTAICGSRGWLPTDDPMFTADDQRIYEHELVRIRASLFSAKNAGFPKKILMLHFPPVFQLEARNEITDMLAEFAIDLCIFGHIHDDANKTAPVGVINGTACQLVACDALNFKLIQLRSN